MTLKSHPFAEFVNSHLARLLKDLKMDVVFVRGEGCVLRDAEGREYLDCIASYGALPFGFNHPKIWEALMLAKEAREPSFVQPSFLEAAGELAERLISIAPRSLRYVTFANSGAEAVEAALKACRAATGRRRVLATHNSFHGKTFGALSATGKPSYQEPFGAPAEGFDYVPYGDAQALEDALERRPGEYAAFIVEPIQGEGGIVVPPPGYMASALKVCKDHGTLFVADEVQTGLGRTGTLFACEHEGVSPDAMVLAKALGGGLFPVGACLLSEEAYTEDFALKHSSTFAGNSLACRTGIAALELLAGGDILRNVRARGEQLRSGLEHIAKRHPKAIRSVRGRGLMLGIELPDDRGGIDGSLLGVMAEQELLAPVVSGYLLNVGGVRVAPTLNGANVIRIEPPLIITEKECDLALEAVERVANLLSRRSTSAISAHLVCGDERREEIERLATSGPLPAEPLPSFPVEPPSASEGRFGFIVHPLHLKSYIDFDPSLSALSEGELEKLTDLWSSMADPFVPGATRVTSTTGATAYGEFIAVPRTSEELLADRDAATALIAEAVSLAAERGARIVGLGAYTSVVTRGGLSVSRMGVPVTTGNSYAAVTGVEALIQAFSQLGSSLKDAAGAIIGATGSIGSATAALLSEDVAALYLVGNPRNPERSRARLRRVYARVCRHLIRRIASGCEMRPGTLAEELASLPRLPGPDAPEGELEKLVGSLMKDSFPITATLNAARCLPLSDVVISATSSVDTLIEPEMPKPGAVICDMSRPSNVSPGMTSERPDVLIIDGGIVAVPGRPYLGWNFGFDAGLAYACMAETMMLALERRYENFSIGTDISAESLSLVRELARKHGFGLAGFRSFDGPLPDGVWDRVKAARATRAPHMDACAGDW